MGKLSDEIALATGKRPRVPEPGTNLDPLEPEIRERLHSLWRDFAASIPPPSVHAGTYRPAPGGGERHLDMIVDVPDGRYRIVGADWILEIKQQRLVSAVMARPPHFGGDAPIIEVP